jgi:hypothetical protein
MMKKKKRMEGMGLGINITPKKYKAYLLRKEDSQASVFHILLLHHIHLSHTTYQKNVKMSNVGIKLCLNNGKILQGRRKGKRNKHFHGIKNKKPSTETRINLKP